MLCLEQSVPRQHNPSQGSTTRPSIYHAPKLEPTVHFASAPQTAPKQQNGPSNVPLNVTDLANADATTLTPVCFGHHGATQSVPMLVGELSVTFLVTPHTLFGGLASNARPMGVAARNSDRVDVATKVARHSPEQLRCDGGVMPEPVPTNPSQRCTGLIAHQVGTFVPMYPYSL